MVAVRRPATPCCCSPGPPLRRPRLDRLGADPGVRGSHRSRRPGSLPPDVPDAARTLDARARARPDLALPRPRPAQAPRLAARGRDRDRLGRLPSRKGPRLRGGDGASAAPRRAAPGAPAVRGSRRSGDGAAARAGRRRALRLRRARRHRLVRRPTRTRSGSRLRSSSSGALAFRALWLWLRPHRSSACRRRTATGPSELVQRARVATASPTSRCGATRATSSRRAAGRSSPTACSAAPRSSPATRSAMLQSAASSSPSSGASPTRRAGASPSPAPRTDALADYAGLGFKSMYLGDEAVIRPGEFSLDGRAIRKVRQSVSRLEKAGYEVRVLTTGDRRRRAARGAARGLRGVARQLARARVHDGDGCALPLSGHRARRRHRAGRIGRRVPAARPVAGQRRLLARVDAPPPRHPERADGVPDHRDGRWARATSVTELSLNFAVFADFLRAEEDAGRLVLGCSLPAAEGRPALPGRAAAQLQPQVLPALAAALLLLRALDRPAARRARLPAAPSRC